jgi:hypothetical protein
MTGLINKESERIWKGVVYNPGACMEKHKNPQTRIFGLLAKI